MIKIICDNCGDECGGYLYDNRDLTYKCESASTHPQDTGSFEIVVQHRNLRHLCIDCTIEILIRQYNAGKVSLKDKFARNITPGGSR